ncbi:MAG: type II toxin-antitoxin system VapC family toxin [Chloroflexota bacterium]
MHDHTSFFLDTAYIYALVNTRDQWHGAAAAWERRLATERRRLLTTEFVLLEIADGLAAVKFRVGAIRIITAPRESSLVEIVPATSDFFAAALDLYQSRDDKDWGLTDCASFLAMQRHGLQTALTTDEHFRQAGFLPLLLDPPSPHPYP